MTALEPIFDAVARFRDRPAIEDADGRVLSYSELMVRARAFAATVPERAGAVAVPAVRSPDFIVSCLGVWIAGAAWIPIDPDEPAARRAAILGRLSGAGGDSDMAYAIATSGSTGVPKVVRVRHRGIPGLWRAQIEAFELGVGARALWLHAPVFDASLSDWGTALASGATLVIPSRAALASDSALRAELANRGITHVDLPPSLLGYLADPPAALRVVVLGGEACAVERVRALARRLRVVVVYGPTEATVCSSLVVVDGERWTRPLIGAPLPGVVYEVRDGELWIGGDGVALGYAGDAEETARRFVESDRGRMFRTGDRVEACAGGLAFVGRVDRQTKLAGRRVELDEIEAVVRRAAGVRDAAVEVRTIAKRERVVAFVEPGGGRIDTVRLRTWLRGELPAWMVPARIVVGQLPRSATGKLDRAALALAQDAGQPLRYAGALEAELAALWCDALGIEGAVGDERFGAAGGDSIGRLALQAALAARGHANDAAMLADDPTFAELCTRVRAGTPRFAPTVAACVAAGRAALARVTAGPPEARVTRRDRGAVLFTGATGLLGARLLRAWRARDDRPMIALVRAPDEASARRRLEASVGDIDDLEVMYGDLARPQLGLAGGAWQTLASRVAAIVHGAAAMNLADGWDEHAAVNVGGTAEIARLVAAGDHIAWHHVSTLSVFVGTDRAPGRHAETDRLDPEARVSGGYAQTKIAAEAIAMELRGRDRAPTTIFRLGLLVPIGQAERADQLAMTIRGLARLGAVPRGAGPLRFDVTPVEHAAAAIAALALRAERCACDEIHHVASASGASITELVVAMRAAGARVDELAPAAWADRARGCLADPDVAMAYLALGRSHAHDADRERMRPFDLCLATGADFAVERTRALLAELAVATAASELAVVARAVTAALEGR